MSSPDLLVAVDPTSEVPLHRQVYDGVRSAILTGRLKSGDKLPATRALAVNLALSRTTVAEAYDQLHSEGYIFGRHGSGTYVAPDLLEGTVHDGRAVSIERGRSGAQTPLSAWGRQVLAGVETHSASEQAAPWRFDFRPHRIANDAFPWNAWRASVDRALNEDREHLAPYPPIGGHEGLRTAIAGHVSRFRAVNCSPDQIVIVNGTQQGLNLVAQLFLESGDPVAVEEPGYPVARQALAARGLRVNRIPVDEDGMLVERVAAAGPQRLVHVTPSHHVPTGATLSLGRRMALLEVAADTGCLVFEDDYDSEFRYEGRPVESLQGLDQSGLVVYAGTFSKSLLAGLRIGFLVLPPALVRPFMAAKLAWDGGTSMLEQAALAQFMESGDYERHIRRMRRLYRHRRDALLSALDDAFGATAITGGHHGGLNMLVTLRISSTGSDLAARAAERGIALRSASPYYEVPPEYPTFLMGFAGLTEDEIREGVARLAALAYER